MAGRQRCAAMSGFVRFKKYAFAVNQCLRSGSGLHGSIFSRAPLGCLCANFAANQSSANRRFRAHRLAHQLDAHRFKGTVLLLRGCYSHCYALSSKVRFRRQPARQPGPSTRPEKCAFVGNRPGNHALVTIQQMPDSLDTSVDTAPGYRPSLVRFGAPWCAARS